MIPMKTRLTIAAKNNAVVLHAPEEQGSFNIPSYIFSLLMRLHYDWCTNMVKQMWPKLWTEEGSCSPWREAEVISQAHPPAVRNQNLASMMLKNTNANNIFTV